MRSCAPIPALAANFIDRRLASQAPGLLQGRAVVAVVVLLLPSVNRSFESLAVPGPHRVDERVPALALSGPFLVVVLGGRLLDGLHELGVVLVDPAVDVIEERVMAPGLLGVHEPQGQSLGHPAHARAAAAIGLAGVLALLLLRWLHVLVGESLGVRVRRRWSRLP
jgi:hypothetical protein